MKLQERTDSSVQFLTKAMNTCPCCSEPLLRHARHNSIYWFCPHCRQEMPNFSTTLTTERQSKQPLDRFASSLDLVR